MPISITNRTTKNLPKLPTINSFLRISFKCEPQGLHKNQTEVLFHFLDDHVDFGDVVQNYSLILEGKDDNECGLSKIELGIKDEFAGHLVEGIKHLFISYQIFNFIFVELNITKLDKFTTNSTSILKHVDGMVWSKIIFVQLSNKSLNNWKNYANYGINFLVNDKGRMFEHLGWSKILGNKIYINFSKTLDKMIIELQRQTLTKSFELSFGLKIRPLRNQQKWL